MSATNGGAEPTESVQTTSGIDWSIFRDGEDDTFTWLWRTNAAAPDALAGMGPPSLVEATGALNSTASIAQSASTPLVPPVASTPAPKQPALLQRSEMPAQSQQVINLEDDDDDDEFDQDDFDDDDEYDDDQDQGDLLHTGSDKSNNEQASQSANQQQQGGKGGKRLGKRRKGSSGVDEEKKKQQRRVKNLASVREFRKRKMKQQEENEARLRRLEAENMDLKMRLKIGKEALVSEQREKQQIKEQMREMLQRGASEQEVARFLNMYKVTYSDYGPKRREKIQFHLARIRELLLPTQVTKLSLYSVEQGSEMIARDRDLNEDTTSAVDAGMAPMSLWGILAKELNVSAAQQRQILERRASIQRVRDDLNETLGIVKQLEQVTEDKNTALEAHIAELQRILTPSQATKFIIWVKENPAFMYMLDKLVDSTLMGTEE
ncbi:hypothetical protein Poli38472_005037 [Pythium oligandrum]|uniref:BZIP domain-containing protein n=1 Tax=Pythium oligandrum TaxID=41045 RepID=A0A8K1CG57_PYTOL|nr:hypothetical protein Poli38472_005037 [Pythium oligandrum]|eukprot:TMW62419.1 hypothetical protein Poli38472_005037 [Pythium oligandrum]